MSNTKILEYGKDLKVPFYDIKQFENMTQEEMDDLLRKYPKGTRRKCLEEMP